ncbi:HAMP domain-containing sensor histidine kinase [Brevibacillus laterosporus]|nr:HAMP domain-containing sensor histidine kinase [Brevibacillus laterosporus]AYB41314.1 sensor histidine kinase [Brevibacillus laterosporus]MED2001793.1 HAMP domain-containing sensor histidine kinase [Brevibacillus laterosporus]MED4764397.1 HAMP domain-containing sensor histidine kinase [Brevibacillus laterosporus]NKQ21889.1 HAMP domain-containing histidine kinase [Brevibacillus laterosporus]PPA83119.1 sensor histidine kinase [Brevibacillus laterosporus]
MKEGEGVMVNVTLLTYEQISKFLVTLVPTITDKWLDELEDLFHPYRVTLPRHLAEKPCYLISLLLIRDVYEEDIRESSHDIGNWFWSEKLPLSLALKTFQILYHVYMGEIQSNIPLHLISSEELSSMEKRLKILIDEALYQAVHNYEDLVQNELSEKEETISYLHNDKLEMLDKIAANMAHELRNPLCAIEGFLKLILESTNGNHVLENYVQVVLHEFDSFHRQITGFLSFCKKPILDEIYKKVSLTDLLHEVEILLTPRLHAENVTLIMRMEPCDLNCYKEGLSQVLIHLLNNAIDAVSSNVYKHVQVSTYKHTDSLTIMVENNGEEIPQDLVEKLFQPFFSTKDDNTGIGLSICKNIIEKHNGSIYCESNSTATRFFIRLPYDLQ